MGAAAFDQDAFRGRDDDVALNSATFNGGGGLNTNWTQAADTNFRIRLLIQETAGGMGLNSTFTLFFSHNGGAYTEMTTATLLRPADTTQYTNGATTTQVIGSGTYVTDESLGGVDNAEDTGNIDLDPNTEAEIEFCLTINSAQVSDSDTIAIRAYLSNGTILDSYTNTPTVTVSVAAPTLTVGGLDSTTQIDAPALTQVHNITVAGLDSTTQVDTFAITQDANLIVAGLDSTTQADTFALTQLHNISVAGLDSTTAIDNVTLGGYLLVDGLASTTQADAVTLTPIYSAVAADMRTQVLADAATLAEQHNITVADLFSTSFLDAQTVTQVHSITVAGLDITTTIDNIGWAVTAVVQDMAVVSLADAASPLVINVALVDTWTLETRSLALTLDTRSTAWTVNEEP